MNTVAYFPGKRQLFCFLFGVVCGASICWLFGLLRTLPESETTGQQAVPAVRETVTATTATTIAYVPKETVTVTERDPISDREVPVQNREKTDVEAQVGKPTVNVKVNGQTYPFELLQEETQKFEKGKISLLQNTEVGLDLQIAPQVIDRTKRSGIDLFAGRYSGIGIQYHRLGLDVGTDGKKTDFRLRWRIAEW